VEHLDVAIVGYGPVGMVMAALLGQAGRRVAVLERYGGKYNLPRAAIFDDETMRTFAKLGIARDMLPKVHAQRRYEWRNAAGELLIEHDFAEQGRSGWAEWYMMYQPDLEDALDRVCHAQGVSVRFDSCVTAIDQHADHVSMTIEGQDTPVTARYVVACDGGNSFVRGALDVDMDDYGFSEPWMVCDFRLDGPVADLPMARQVCDPAQPISIISLGPDHHRFSFMLDADEDPMVEREPDRVWRRVSNYLRPDQATLIRAATYTFRSLIATRWRDRRILLAGDAAHQMPPFLGQGMCSGIRDALNLYWKLDLALAGADTEALLDSYRSERDPHVRAVTAKGIELGRVQTMRDPAAAAARDEQFLRRRRDNAKPDKIVFPPLGDGAFGGGAGAGELFPQAIVRDGARHGRFDEVVGYGPMVVARAAGSQDTRDWLRAQAARSGLQLVFVAKDGGDGSLADVQGSYLDWLDAHGCAAVAIRPDFHVWGSVGGAEGTGNLIERFAAFLRPDQVEPAADPTDARPLKVAARLSLSAAAERPVFNTGFL